MIEENLLNQGAFTAEAHTQLRNSLSNKKRKKAIINQSSIHATLPISVMNVTARNQIQASDVDWRKNLFQIVLNQALLIIKFNVTHKIINLIHIDRQQ